MGIAYVDCEACRCLIRSEESACPFCGQRPSVISTAGGHLRIFGLAAGLAAATMSCAADDKMPTDTVADADATVNDDDNADAVTYAGPDDASITETESDTFTTTTQPDPSDADAVTYAGPDESESTDPFPETSSESGTDATSSGTETTTSSGTDESSTGSSGTGDTDANG